MKQNFCVFFLWKWGRFHLKANNVQVMREKLDKFGYIKICKTPNFKNHHIQSGVK